MLLFCCISFPPGCAFHPSNRIFIYIFCCLKKTKQKKTVKMCFAVKVSQWSRRRRLTHRCSARVTCVFQAEPLNFCAHTDHFTQAIFVRIVRAAFRRWIMLVKSDKTAFVLPLRSSEKLSFNPFKGRDWEAQTRFHCDFPLCPPQSGVCMSDSASYLFAGSMLRWPM